MSKRLVVLAHPDDEILCLPFLLDSSTKSGQIDYFLYLTFNSLSETRKKECERAIKILDQEVRNSRLIKFESVLRDGHGWEDIKICDVNDFLRHIELLDIDSILTFAYEGGHQDHDLAHVVSKLLQDTLSKEIIEFSGYRKHPKFPVFIVCKPAIKLLKINFRRGKALSLFLRLVVTYKSQLRVWFLLSPRMLLNLAFGATYVTQSKFSLSSSNDGLFLYELRGKAQKELVESALAKIVKDSSKGK